MTSRSTCARIDRALRGPASFATGAAACLALSFSLVLNPGCVSRSVTIDAEHERWPIRRALQRDELDPALGPEHAAALPYEPAEGASDAPLWIRIDLDVVDLARPLYLSASPPFDPGSVLVPTGDGWTESELPASGLLPLPITERGPTFVLLHLDRMTRAPDQLEITTLEGQVAARSHFFWQGAYIGGATLVLLFNLLLVRPGRAHLPYAALVAANVAYFALRSGVVSCFLGIPAESVFRAELVALMVSVGAALVFTRALFDAPARFPRFDWVLRAYFVPLVALALLMGAGLAGYGAARSIGLSFPILAMLSGWLAYRAGAPSALPYLVGWTFYALGVLALAAPVLPSNAPLSPAEAFQLGSALELTSLSIALVMQLRAEARERERAEARAAQAERLATLGTLAASVAHEVNNPTNLITFNLPLLDRYLAALVEPDPALPPDEAARDAREAIDEMRRATGRITAVVGQLKGHARRSEAWVRRDLEDIARAALDATQHLARPGLVIEAEFAGALPPIEVAPERLERAILNLLTNAIEATADRDRAQVRLRTSAHPTELWLEVIDDGPGVDAQLEGLLFEPFVTGRPGTSGTGLGLALARDTAREHGGSLEMQRARDETIFRLRLPLRRKPT